MMERITTDEEDINSPELYDSKFNGTLGVHDMERHELLASKFKGGTYVDVGCFDSIMPILIAERFPKSTVYAFDYAPKLIDFLEIRFSKVKYRCQNISEGLPFDRESVDYVCAGELIEHLKDPAAFVQDALRVLKPGGWLAISTPFEAVKRSSGDEVGGDAHLWRWTKADIEQLLGTTETKVIQESNTKTILAWRQK